jgi:N-acetyl sugar amidotransferase
MKFCKRCVNPDTRPNIFFDEDGVCPVCKFNEQKANGVIDWKARRKELDDILEWGKKHTKSSYDCIVTVSGGKDSARQAFFARDEMKANPLLVSCMYPPEQLSELGAYNFSNLISRGFDTIGISLNPQKWKDLMKYSFFKFGNWCRSTEMALYAIPIHVAITYKIPLIFLGENPALTIGEKHGRLDGDASKMKYCNTLEGGDVTPYLIEGVTRTDLHYYGYPSDDEMEYGNLRIIYLGYYIEDWAGHKNAKFAMDRGLKIRNDPPEDMGDLWGFSGLDEDFRLVNQMIKYIKFGFGHVNDQVCEAINHGMMTREEGIELLKKYDGKCSPKYIKRYCGYLGITEKQFWEVVERFRGGENVWIKDKNGEWKLNLDYR